MKNKYGAKKTEILFNGVLVTFDSKAEAKRAKELELLERAGYITDLILQPAFILQNTYKRGNKRVSAITYVADFEYVEKSGKVVIEDVKGMKTPVYNLKKKMFLCTLPDDVVFRESSVKNGRFQVKDF